MLLQRAGLTAGKHDVNPARVDFPHGDDMLGNQLLLPLLLLLLQKLIGPLPSSMQVGLASWVIDNNVEDVLYRGCRKEPGIRARDNGLALNVYSRRHRATCLRPF